MAPQHPTMSWALCCFGLVSDTRDGLSISLGPALVVADGGVVVGGRGRRGGGGGQQARKHGSRTGTTETRRGGARGGTHGEDCCILIKTVEKSKQM